MQRHKTPRHECPYCDKTFVHIGNLVNHLCWAHRQETIADLVDEPPYARKCVCGRVFSGHLTHYDLRNHIEHVLAEQKISLKEHAVIERVAALA